jgi:RHS repeat-associated protein
MLDNIDMVHMNGRIYEPNIARFVSADPIIQDPEHSQSYNRYSYVWNNPTNLTDPTGFCADSSSVASSTSSAKACGGFNNIRTEDIAGGISAQDNPDGTRTFSARLHNGQKVSQTATSSSLENSTGAATGAAKGGGCGGSEGMCHSGGFRPPSENDVRAAGTLLGTGAVLGVGAATGTLPLAVLLIEVVNLADGVPGGKAGSVVKTEANAVANVGLAEARAARDALAADLAPLKGKGPATVTGGYNVQTGQVAARACGGGKCAEDHVRDALGGEKGNVRFTEAMRPRTGQQVPVCARCEATYGRDHFPSGTTRFKTDE